MELQNFQKKVRSILQLYYFYIVKIINTKTINKNEQTMCTIANDKLKQMVQKTAELLCVSNGQTTTLEVKNSIHLLVPGCGLNQVEVSAMFQEVFNESNLFERENASTNGKYFIYTLKVPATASTTPTNDVSAPAVPALPVQMAAIVTTGAKSAVVGNIGAHPVDFLKKLDSGIRVAYNAGKNDYVLTNVTDQFEARKLFKTTTGAKHNDVRTITLKTYLKRIGA